MKHYKLFLIILSCYCIFACVSQKQIATKPRIITSGFTKKQTLTKEEKKNWHFKDIYEDSIPGISLSKAYDFLKGKKGDTIIVAVIDTELDILQEDLKNQIWVNKDEIPDNNIDDDNNGYVDDIHGWNYVGTKKGDEIPYSHFECVRIIKKYDSLFKNVTTIKEVSEDKKEQFKVYQKAYLDYHKRLKTFTGYIDKNNNTKKRYNAGIDVLKLYLPNIEEPYNLVKLDSLKETITNKEQIEKIEYLIKLKKYDVSVKYINNRNIMHQRIIDRKLNFDFNDRYLTNDNIHDINDFPYGNNDVQGTQIINHATEVSSVIAATRNNDIGIDGINNLVKIMPLSIAVAGNEQDKDIALAIRYAVDNGAKVINMSYGKEMSIYPNWVNEAIKYAEKNNVLLITSSGNNGWNIDKNDSFPRDKFKGIEEVKNFITVGNTSYKIDSILVHSASNYGKQELDIFAPGWKLPVLTRSKVTTDTGTSLSCAVVSGIASLVFSYYPDLTAKEIKEIILKSGTSIDLMVLKPYARGDKRDPNKVFFSSLSKSGKIVNAYNALLMAEEVSKKKKKRN
ncbi:S8 family serine peptidase [Kordia sp.]|uniref:S8 family serine peptidase n=1 Tax=Kordia sp. TaxID=1965332 RepID=UPI003B5AB03C